MLPADLAGWLERIERLHPKTIELGLDRVATVRDRMGLALEAPVITVAGTNGKGSTCALLESILAAARYRVGLYTSPHLLAYNERVRVDRRDADDATLVAAFARVEAARVAGAPVPLTYFEFGTLAAVAVFAAARLDAVVLEVGMGGRLDAVNAFEPDAAIVTTVALDHMDYLGGTREAIGREKAHVFRPGRPAIVGDPAPPESVTAHARAIGADLQCLGRDFGYEADGGDWLYWGRLGRRAGLPHPALRGAMQLANAATAIAALESLRERLPVTAQDVRDGLVHVALPGRFQVLPGRPVVVLDVAHNPAAAVVLAENLARMETGGTRSGRTLAVFGMLWDKDVAGVVRAMKPAIDLWFVADLPGPRGAAAGTLAAAIAAEQAWAQVRPFATVAQAYAAARDAAGPDDRIVAFGSFLTVAEVMSLQKSGPGRR
ncbi:MAG: bifunctional tetrahydrofolate synthase/dihydrofolate synthase [Burkholderiales bacterium]|nr:bifunctional tetrahydrofolate synthase/dihydrofolate synthase [Burkholderiales bacterium]